MQRDTDTQFSITCEGDSGAKVAINLTTQLLEGRPFHIKHLMAGQLCTNTGIKRTYSASDPGKFDYFISCYFLQIFLKRICIWHRVEYNISRES